MRHFELFLTTVQTSYLNYYVISKYKFDESLLFCLACSISVFKQRTRSTDVSPGSIYLVSIISNVSECKLHKNAIRYQIRQLHTKNCIFFYILSPTRCLKITEKVSFNITIKTSTFWVYKSPLKMPKMVNFGEFF